MIISETTAIKIYRALLIRMDETELGNERTIRSVKAAIDMYGGGKIKQGTNVEKKFQNDAAFSKVNVKCFYIII